MQTHIFIITSLATFTWCVPLPPSFKKCNRKRSDFNECMVEAFNNVITQLNVPMRELDLPSLEPLEVPLMSIGAGKGPAAFQQIYKDLKVSGLTKNKFEKIELDFDKNTLDLVCSTPEMRMDFEYEFSGKILLLPISGNGPGTVSLFNVTNNLKHKLETYEKKGKNHFRIVNTTFEFEPQFMKSKFEKLLGGDDALNNNLNEVINENWRELIEDVGPSYRDAFLQIFTTIINRFFAKVPIAELFDNE